MEIVIEFDKDAQIRAVTSQTIKYFLEASKEQLTNEIQEKTPVKTRNLRQGFKPSIKGNELHITNSVNYAPFVELGTSIYATEGRHRIFPKNANVLHAVIDGDDVFFANSRGQPGQHMAKKGAEAFKPKIPNLFALAMKKTMTTK